MMKTTVRFTVIHGSLYAANYLEVQRFAELIPADMVLYPYQTWTDLIVRLDVTLNMESNPPGQKAQVSAYLTLQLRDIHLTPKDTHRNFVEHIRQDLFAKIGDWLRVEVEQAAPPMPPEPKPVYVPTDVSVDGQKLAFESTGDTVNDDVISRKLNRAIIFLQK